MKQQSFRKGNISENYAVPLPDNSGLTVETNQDGYTYKFNASIADTEQFKKLSQTVNGDHFQRVNEEEIEDYKKYMDMPKEEVRREAQVQSQSNGKIKLKVLTTIEIMPSIFMTFPKNTISPEMILEIRDMLNQ